MTVKTVDKVCGQITGNDENVNVTATSRICTKDESTAGSNNVDVESAESAQKINSEGCHENTTNDSAKGDNTTVGVDSTFESCDIEPIADNVESRIAGTVDKKVTVSVALPTKAPDPVSVPNTETQSEKTEAGTGHDDSQSSSSSYDKAKTEEMKSLGSQVKTHTQTNNAVPKLYQVSRLVTGANQPVTIGNLSKSHASIVIVGNEPSAAAKTKQLVPNQLSISNKAAATLLEKPIVTATNASLNVDTTASAAVKIDTRMADAASATNTSNKVLSNVAISPTSLLSKTLSKIPVSPIVSQQSKQNTGGATTKCTITQLRSPITTSTAGIVTTPATATTNATATSTTPAPLSNTKSQEHHSSSTTTSSTISSLHNHHLIGTSSSQKRKKFRSPLSDMYHPYVQPTDTNLEDARKRLHIAMEQTRALRLAFTNRVYEKYRVVLRMQSLALETKDIVALIQNDPKKYLEALMKDVDFINGEKELEKKEAQVINSQLNSSGIGGGIDSSHNVNAFTNVYDTNLTTQSKSKVVDSPSSKPMITAPSIMSLFNDVENAEQLSWFNAGLSLVILPEDPIDVIKEQLDKRQITYRAPMDVESGTKVKDISTAAAVAGNIMIDRVRKAKEFRSMRRGENVTLSGFGDGHTFDKSNLSEVLINMTKSDGEGINIDSKPGSINGIYTNIGKTMSISPTFSRDISKLTGVGKDGRSNSHNTSTATAVVEKLMKGNQTSAATSTLVKHHNKLSITIPSTSSINKGKMPRATNSLVTLLSMSPTIEGRRKSGKLSACASALVTHGISHIPSSKKGGTTSFGHGGYYNHHQNVGDLNTAHSSIASTDGISPKNKHPFPLSKGALSMSSAGTYVADVDKEDKDVALPPLMTSIERKKQKDEDFLDFTKTNQLSSVRGVEVMKRVLKMFEETPDNDTKETPLKIDNDESAKVSEDGSVASKIKKLENKNVTSIESKGRVNLKRHISEISIINTLREEKMRRKDDKESINTRVIDPVVALSVLQAVGYVSHEVCQSKPSSHVNDGYTLLKEQLMCSQNPLRANKSNGLNERPVCKLSSSNTMSEIILCNGVERNPKDISVSECRNGIKLASYVPSLRGGGGSNDSPKEDARNDKPKKDGNSVSGSNEQTNSSFPSVQHIALSQQLQAQQRQNADMLNAATALWNEQKRNSDIAMLQAQSASLPQVLAHQAQNMDRYASLMSAGVQTSPNGGINMLSQGALQAANLSQSLNDTSDQYINGTNQAINNHLRLAQIQQNSPVMHANHLLHHHNSDLSDYFTNNMQAPQTQNYTMHHNDWTALRLQSNGLSHSPIDTSQLGLSSHQTELLVRQRATQLLLAREQQLQAQVAAAQRNAAVFAYNNTSLSTPSPSFQASTTKKNSTITVGKKNSNTVSSASTKQTNSERATNVTTNKHPVNTRPTTAPGSSISPRSSKPPELTKVSNQRPSTVPPPNSNPNDSGIKLSSFDTTDLHKLSKSVESIKKLEPIMSVNKVGTIKEKVTSQKPNVNNVEASKSKGLNSLQTNNNEKESTMNNVEASKSKGLNSLQTNNNEKENAMNNVEASKSKGLNSLQTNNDEEENTTSASSKRVLFSNSKDEDFEANGKTKVNKEQSTYESSHTPDSEDIDTELLQTTVINNSQKADEKSFDNYTCKPEAVGDKSPAIKTNHNDQYSLSQAMQTTEMRFFIPPHSEKIEERDADAILKGLFHSVVATKDDNQEKWSLLEYLLSVGAAVPIPKALVSVPLKEMLNKESMQSLISSTEANTSAEICPHEIINAVITTWIWSKYSKVFEGTYAQHGRVDTDPKCSWIIKASIDVVVTALVEKSCDFKKNAAVVSSSEDGSTTKNIEEFTKLAIYINEALSRGYSCNMDMEYILPNLDSLVDHLDKLRLCALKSRSQERALLASLVSRRSRMSEAFSHSYASAMIRAGEALGYDELGDIVQDEDTKSSTMLPFDILGDSFGAWEDPCRPHGGFVPGLDGDELFKRAHARAMIQKSLKKLQDRHLIRGGTPSSGPYADVQPSDQGKLSIKTANGVSNISPPKPSPRSSSGSKRKLSISSSADVSGFAVFNPAHYSSPFVWDTNDTENTPYGRSSPFGVRFKRPRLSFSTTSQEIVDEDDGKIRMDDKMDGINEGYTIRSTHEIEWKTVADMFEPVVINEKSSSRFIDHHHSVAVPAGSTIIAPFCRKVNMGSDNEISESLCTISDDDESDSEEELDDEKILEAHQRVLNHIKEKFTAMMKARQEIQERQRRARSS